MRSSWKTLVVAVAGWLVVPQLANADEVQDQLRQMQERMSQLEDKLQATTEELDEANKRSQDQEKLIERSGLADERSGLSALSRFLNETEFSGVVAASYNWNFNDPNNNVTQSVANGFPGAGIGTRVGTAAPGAGNNSGVLGLTAPFHQNNNTYQLDQALFSMIKPSTEESRGGFGVEVAFGASADALNSGGSATGDDTFLYQAYASYLAPVLGGVQVKAGRYATILGAEVFRVDDNFNITRGLNYALQPTSHTGVLWQGEMGEGYEWALGVANNNTNTMVDTDSNKTLLARLGWSGETAGVKLNWMYGGDVVSPTTGAGKDGDRLSELNLVTTWDPSDNLSMWLNFDWITQRQDNLGSLNVYSTAVAGRLALTDTTGVSTRFEYVKGEDVCNLTGDLVPGPGVGAGSPCSLIPLVGATDDIDLFSITGTLDHALTDNLTVRGELRYDWGSIDGGQNGLFLNNGTGANGPGTVFGASDQLLALVQMYYTF